MDYTQVAKDVLQHVGGKENIAHLEHCSTRLRFTLIDQKKADVPALEKTPGGHSCQNVRTMPSGHWE